MAVNSVRLSPEKPKSFCCENQKQSETDVVHERQEFRNDFKQQKGENSRI